MPPSYYPDDTEDDTIGRPALLMAFVPFFHTPKAGLLAMLAARFAGVRLRIHTIAGLRFVTTKGFGRKVLIAMEKLTGKAASHVWPNSYSMEQYIIENKLVSPKKLEVIGHGSSNGVSLSRYSIPALSEEKIEETLL